MVKTLEEKKRGKGQPTKYKPEFCQAIIEFFNEEPYEDIEIEHFDKSRSVSWVDKKRMPRKFPTLVEFGKSIGICYATVFNWIDKKHASFQKDFLDAFTRAKEGQKNFLIQNGLQGLYNPLFAKFVALNVTDMKDEAVIDNSRHIYITHDYRAKNKTPASPVRAYAGQSQLS